MSNSNSGNPDPGSVQGTILGRDLDNTSLKRTVIGRTGIETTVAGLGCGGFSRLGLKKYGQPHAANIVRIAYERGIRFFDTATAYGTEPAVGIGLEGIPRHQYALSTKFPTWEEWRPNYKAIFEKTLEESLAALKTDYIDVYNIHGVSPKDYPDVKALLVPEMHKAQAAGKIKFLGITEAFGDDNTHQMLDVALTDDIFDVIMVGYNILNPSAAKTIFPRAIKQNVGVQCMFAVRHALHDPVQLVVDLQKILDNNQGGPGLTATKDALDFLTQPSPAGKAAAKTIMDAAYRFCTHTEGIHVVLTGTSSEAHLADNLASIESEPLPDEILTKLELLFGNSSCVSGQ